MGIKIDTNEVIKLHNAGLNPFEISEEIHSTVQNVHIILKKNDLTPNIGVFKHNWVRIDSGLAYCPSCQETKNQLCFNKSSKSYTGFNNTCKDCSSKRTIKCYNKSINSFLRALYGRTVRRAKARNIFFSLTLEEYSGLYFKQDGKCFYTDKLMTWGYGRGRPKDSITLDRIVPEKGYVLGNIVFCTNKVNYVKSDTNLQELMEWMPGWYSRLVNNNLELDIDFSIFHNLKV